MKAKRLAAPVILPAVLLTAFLGLRSQEAPPQAGQDAPPVKRPATDYMSTLLSRNTKPLGLKEDKTLQRLLRQSAAVWAVRTAARHVLD